MAVSLDLGSEEVIFIVFGKTQDQPFVRGDANTDRRIDLADAVTVLSYLFLGTQSLKCGDAADVDDSGALDITDPIALLKYLFLGAAPPREPFPTPGIDPTEDDLTCRRF